MSQDYYKDVPQEQRNKLFQFRQQHPHKNTWIGSRNWYYISGGNGEEAILFLSGAIRTGEPYFEYINSFEGRYRIIAPTYPHEVNTMQLMCDDLAILLKQEGINKTHIVSASYGGMVAQCFAILYPDMVGKLVLANSALPNHHYSEKIHGLLPVLRVLPEPSLKIITNSILARYRTKSPLRSFWNAYLKEQVDGVVTKQWLMEQYRQIIDYCENYQESIRQLILKQNEIFLFESDHDEAISSNQRKAIREFYASAPCHTFTNAGHFNMGYYPDEYIALIRDFLDRK